METLRITRETEARISVVASTLKVMSDLACPETNKEPAAQISRDELACLLQSLSDQLSLADPANQTRGAA